MAQWIKVGLIGKAHGLRGHFFIAQRSLALPEDCKELCVGSKPDAKHTYEIAESFLHSARPIAKLKGLNDRTAIEKLTGEGLWMQREDAGEALVWDDFIGKTLVDSEDNTVGVIEDVVNFGANDSLVVRRPTDKKTLHIPLVATYIDLAFKAGDPHVKLLVPQYFFAEFWNV